jgi:hypothetical protein
MSEFQEKYWNAIQSQLNTLIEPVISNKEFQTDMKNALLGLGGPRLLPRKYSNRDRYFSLVFYGYLEVIQSWYRLQDIETYIEGLPSLKSKISKSRYLSYHIENYYSEIYIFRNRLVDYAKKILRANKQARDYDDKKAIMDIMINGVYTLFSSFISIRGNNVHKYRFEDDDIDRSLQWEIIISTPPDNTLPFFRKTANYMIRKARKKWIERIKEYNSLCSVILDTYFKAVYSIVFDKSGKLKYI